MAVLIDDEGLVKQSGPANVKVTLIKHIRIVKVYRHKGLTPEKQQREYSKRCPVQKYYLSPEYQIFYHLSLPQERKLENFTNLVYETRRERPKSAPYLRLKNIQGTTIGKIWKKIFSKKNF